METLPFWLWNRNCPYFADSGAADILVEEQEPPLVCRCWSCNYFLCGTGTALIFPIVEMLLFWLRNRNRSYFADFGDAAILVVEPEQPLFC